MIVLDTSLLVEALSGAKRKAPALRAAIERGERMLLPSIVLYEWLRGPRSTQELATQEALFPAEQVLAFGPEDARVAAALYRQVSRARSREIDLAIAACAIVLKAELWTMNTKDFRDIPGLRLRESY